MDKIYEFINMIANSFKISDNLRAWNMIGITEDDIEELDFNTLMIFTRNQDVGKKITRFVQSNMTQEECVQNLEKNNTDSYINYMLLMGLNDEKLQEYFENPEKLLAMHLTSDAVDALIRTRGNKLENYLFEGQSEESRLTMANIIKGVGKINEYLADIKKMNSLSIHDKIVLILKGGDVNKYINCPEKLIEIKLDNEDIDLLIRTSGVDLEKYLLEGQAKDSKLTIVNVIKSTGRVNDYLENPELLEKLGVTSKEKCRLIELSGEIEKYLIPERLYDLGIVNSWDIDYLIRKTGKIEKYLFEGQSKKSLLTMANVIKGTNKIKEYLVTSKLLKYMVLTDFDITNLIDATGEREKYLFDDQEGKGKFSLKNVLYREGNLNKDEIELLFSLEDYDLIETVVNLDKNKQKDAVYILSRLSNSNSAELRRIKDLIAIQILEKSQGKYKETLEKIEEIYLTNNIPNIGKSFLVFQELNPGIFVDENCSLGNIPSLRNASLQERKHIIWSNMLMISLESGDSNLREYLEMIEKGSILYERAKEGKIDFSKLNKSDDEYKIMSKYCEIINALYNLTASGKKRARVNSGDLQKDIQELDELFINDTNIHMTLPDRIVKTFGYWAGVTTFQQAKNILENSKREAQERNIQIAKNGKIELEEGDYVKGIQNTKYLPFMLQRGCYAKDFHGGCATSDHTPGDLDVEIVENKGKTFKQTYDNLKIATRYTTYGDFGSILLVFSRDDFIQTRDKDMKINYENIEMLRKNRNKKEVFYNSGKACGITCGIASTKIKAIIADKYIDKLGLEIAKCGFYIPVVDRNGNVIYTPEMYYEFREKMKGLSHYGEAEFTLDDTAKNKGITEIIKLIEKNEQNSRIKRKKILNTMRLAVDKIGYKLIDERLLDLTPGFIEYIDIGSTGRGTNEPSDGDFDFMVRMDKILSLNSGEFKRILRDVLNKIEPVEKAIETSDGDFRYKGVTIEGLNSKVDIDLTFTERTDEIEYSTDECIKDRLKTIKQSNSEDFKYVIANILLAKRMLKQVGAYKKKDAPKPKEGEKDTRGGLGAIGIENWILQNGGSFERAAKTFLDVAEKSESLEDFQSKYPIWDFGENHIAIKKTIYPHDNFIYNLSNVGYERMKNVLSRYIETVNKERRTQESDTISIAEFVEQDPSVIMDRDYLLAVKFLLDKQKELDEELIL